MAAVAVLALIACAFVAFAPTESSNGLTAGTPVAGAELEGSNATITEGTYFYVNSEVVITSMTGTTVNIYLGENGKVTLPETIATTTTIQAGTFDEKTGMITPYTGLIITGVGEKTYTAVDAVSGYGISAPSDSAATDFGVKITGATEDNIVYYPDGASVEATLKVEGATATAINGTVNATISGYKVGGTDASAKVSINATTATRGIVLSYAATDYPTITSDATAGSVTVTSGVLKVAATTTGLDSIVNAYASADANTAATLIGPSVASLGTITSLYVYGDVADDTTTVDSVNLVNARPQTSTDPSIPLPSHSPTVS